MATRTATAMETKTLVITLAVGGAFAIATAFIFGWRSIDKKIQTEHVQAALAPSVVEIIHP